MADTQFTIDIAARSDSVTTAARALDALTDRMRSSETAATKAADAVKAAEASYRAAETAVDRATKALEKIDVQLNSTREKMKKAMEANDERAFWKAAKAFEDLNAKRAEAAARAGQLSSALASETTALNAARAAAEQAAKANEVLAERTSKLAAAKKKFEQDAKSDADRAADLLKRRTQDEKAQTDRQVEIKKRAEAAARESQQKLLEQNELIGGSLRKLGGPLGEAGGKVFELKGAWDKLGKALGGAAPYVAIAVGVLAIAAALGVAALAAAKAAADIATWAVGLANAKRDAQQLAAGLVQSTAGGRVLEQHIQNVARDVPLSVDEINNLAKGLAQSGLRGKALENALDRAAVQAAKVKFGPDWERQLLSVENQTQQLQRNISRLFGGLKIDPFLAKLRTLVNLFDEDTIAGKAMQTVFQDVFQRIIDWATNMIPAVERAFIQFEILALKALIAIKPFWSTIERGLIVFAVLAAIIGGVFAVALAIAFVPLLVLAAAVLSVVAALVWLQTKWQEISDFMRSLDWGVIGTALIDGLVNGLTMGSARVLGAVKDIAKGAIDGAKGILGIASPSKVFAEIGAYTSEGMALGIDSGAAQVQDSMVSMSSPTVAAPISGAAKGGGSADLSGAVFNFYGVKDAEDASAKFAEVLTRILEGDAAQLGAEVPT